MGVGVSVYVCMHVRRRPRALLGSGGGGGCCGCTSRCVLE